MNECAASRQPRLASRPGGAARVPQCVVAPLARDDGAATSTAAHRLVDDPYAVGGAGTDHPTVEQDANHFAAEQAPELNPGQSGRPRLRDSVESLHRRASMKHSLEVCRSGSEPGCHSSVVGRVSISSARPQGQPPLACRRSGRLTVAFARCSSGDANDRGNLRRSTRLGLLKRFEHRRCLEGLLGYEGNRKPDHVARAAYTRCSRPASRGGI